MAARKNAPEGPIIAKTSVESGKVHVRIVDRRVYGSDDAAIE
jgi:hypothetical protein